MKRILPGGICALHLVLLLGMLLHTSPPGGTRLLGKYSPAWAALIVATALAFPLARRLGAWLAERLPSRRSLLASGIGLLAVWAVTEAWQRAAVGVRELPHPFLQIAPAPSHAALGTNALGLRGDETPAAKPPGTFRILLQGGSTVQCAYLPPGQSPGRLLERALREARPGLRIEVLDAGCSWYTTEHALIQYLFRLRDLSPDLVVAWHGINDLCRSFSPPAYAAGPYAPDYGHYGGPLAATFRDARQLLSVRSVAWDSFWTHASYTLERRLHVTDTLFSDLTALRPAEVRDFPSLSAFRRNLELTADALERDRVPLLLGTQAALFREGLDDAARARLHFAADYCAEDGACPDEASMRRGLDAFNDATRELAARRGIPLADLDRALPRDLEHFIDDCHPTARGAEAAARALAGALLGSGILPAP